MWFGDLVTMRWFNDVWMKEVFANFMAAKIVNPAFPEINHDLRFLCRHYPAAYDVDRTAGTNAIRQRLDNLNEAGSLYGAIIYQKAPIVMRQLEMIGTPNRLREGLREYLKQHSVRQRHVAGPDRDRSIAHDPTISRPGAVPGSKKPGGRCITTRDRRRDGWRSSARSISRSRGLRWTQRLQVRDRHRPGTTDRA